MKARARRAPIGVQRGRAAERRSSVQVVLTEVGRDQARALGAKAGPVDLVAHSAFGRTRETAELAWPGTPLLGFPSGRVHVRELRGLALGGRVRRVGRNGRARRGGAGRGREPRRGGAPLRPRLPDAAGPAGGSSRGDRARRGRRVHPPRARGNIARPCPRRSRASASLHDRGRRPWPGARPHRRLGLVAGLFATPLPRAQPGRNLHPRAGPDRTGRRGDGARLRRRRLDLPLHVLGELGYASRRSTSTTACAASSRTRTRASVARRSAPSRRGAGTTRPSCAMRATQSRPTVCAPPGTRPRIQVESVLLRLVASGSPQRIKASARTASSGRCSGSGARRRAPTAASKGSPTGRTRRTETKRGLIRDEILPLLEQLDPRARASLLALADERPRLPRTLERTLAELLASRTEARPPTSAPASAPSASTARSSRLDGAVEWGPWTIESDRPRARAPPAGRRIASQAGGRKCRICSWMRRCPGRSGTRGRSSSAATRSSPCRAWRRRRGGKER